MLLVVFITCVTIKVRYFHGQITADTLFPKPPIEGIFGGDSTIPTTAEDPGDANDSEVNCLQMTRSALILQ